jgi:hypothetical protein
MNQKKISKSLIAMYHPNKVVKMHVNKDKLHQVLGINHH